ncbi:hypothetical protein GQX73_g7921 [Xylaria multiplex]|uniref:Uncharacterized protein n=1 Tax=Xylaria multiplex TaxID=323545 RepID=A0A7C8IQB5_9PEZI|nr:hypothetical protein GQX73_g7921 [Xylaria multiplex]
MPSSGSSRNSTRSGGAYTIWSTESYYSFNGVPCDENDPNSPKYIRARDARAQQSGLRPNVAERPYPSGFRNYEGLQLQSQAPWLHHPVTPGTTTTWRPGGVPPGAIRSVYSRGDPNNFDLISLMDVSTASDTDTDTSEDLAVQSTDDSIHLKSVPAFVAWQTPDGENRFLSDLNLSLDNNASTKNALVKLQATTRLKKGPAKPSIFLFVKPDQICTLACIGTDADDSSHNEELHRHAREKLGTSTHILRFELWSPPTFVVPSEYPFKLFRAGSQAVWRSWMAFAKDTHCFFLHFPMKSLSKTRLVSFCQIVSTPGALTSLETDMISLYGGKGGKVVDPHADVDNVAQLRPNSGVLNDEDNAPPAYEEHANAGPSLSATVPPLCLSPGPDPPRSRKRRREDSSSTDHDDTFTHEKGNQVDERILHAILGLQRTVEETNAAQEASLARIMVKVEEMEGRFKQLEESQRNLADEVRTYMAPLWDELDGRLQSQEDREHVYIRDVIEEVVDENIKEKTVEAIDEYLKHDDDGQGLIR